MIQILDCTLRDGGYINNWFFGEKNIKNIMINLEEANVDIIECGYIKDKAKLDKNSTIYPGFVNIRSQKKSDTLYVGMINYGEFDISKIPSCDSNTLDGIRVVFKKEEWQNAVIYAEAVKKKGYKVFIQPMATINYTDMELLGLIQEVNRITPEALYIVDSFGVMNRNDLLRLYYLLENNLFPNIKIGYHAHNNLQLAFSNAQSLVEESKKRDIIIDSSIQGMGRGAGNLNTELFVKFLNETYDTDYNIYPLLKIIDETTSIEYSKNYWGYSLPHYLSALYNCHPNYATYLNDKNTLTIKNMEEILSSISLERSQKFDKLYIENLYNDFQKSVIDDECILINFREIFKSKEILVLASGKTIETNEEEIKKYITKDTVVISVNFIPKNIKIDWLFISNAKRAEKILLKENIPCIVTSNLQITSDNKYIVDYNSLLNLVDHVSDNAMLMLLEFLKNVGIRHILLAGFDGYGHTQDYVDSEDNLPMSELKKSRINSGVIKVLDKYLDCMDIDWITESIYNKHSSKLAYTEGR